MLKQMDKKTIKELKDSLERVLDDIRECQERLEASKKDIKYLLFGLVEDLEKWS